MKYLLLLVLMMGCSTLKQNEQLFFYAGKYSELVKIREHLNNSNEMPAKVFFDNEEAMLEHFLFLKGVTKKEIKILRKDFSKLLWESIFCKE